MKNNKLKLVTALSCSIGIAAPASVFATNGMFLISPGTKSRGMGGVSIAMTHDVMSSAVNPAIMAHTGDRFDIGGDIFVPTAESTLGQGTNKITVESKPDHFAISDGVYMMPHMGGSIQSGDISFGFTMLGIGGGGSRYEPNLYNNTNPGADNSRKLGVSLLVMNINPTIAAKLNETHSVGASLIMGVQVFKAYGLDEFTTFTTTQDSTAQFTNEGSQVVGGLGLRLGWLGKFMNNNLTLGAQFTSKTYMDEFDKYKDLFAEQGDLDTPGNIGIGAAYKWNDDLTIAMDLTYIMYDDVAAISNTGPNVSAGPAFPVDRATNALGQDAGLGFGWENQTVIKIGAIYNYNENLVLRAGWNYAKSPIDENEDILFNIVAPASTQHHLTLGATYKWSKDIEISAAYVHAFEYTQGGPTYIGFEGEISMYQDSIGGALAIKF